MVSIFLDTNILLDTMIPNRPQHDEAISLLSLHSQKSVSICISSSSLKDIYYIARKDLPRETILWFVSWFLDNLVVHPIDRAICNAAIDSDEPDFEDGIMRATAERNFADYIITRDKKAYRNSSIRALDAKAFAELGL